jgi:hypothetical protein
MKPDKIMKKLLIFCALALLFSCEKPEAKYCWDCMQYTRIVSEGSVYETSIAIEKCGMSSREIELFEQKTTSGNTTTWEICTKQ